MLVAAPLDYRGVRIVARLRPVLRAIPVPAAAPLAGQVLAGKELAQVSGRQDPVVTVQAHVATVAKTFCRAVVRASLVGGSQLV